MALRLSPAAGIDGGAGGTNRGDFERAAQERQRGSERGGLSFSRQAAEFKDLLSLEKQHQALQKQFRHTDKALSSARCEGRRAKEAMEAMGKELDLLRRHAHDMAVDKKALEEELKEAVGQAKRSECKLVAALSQMGPATLDRRNTMYETIKDLKAQREALKGALKDKEDKIDNMAKERAAMLDGLRMREEELGIQDCSGNEEARACLLLKIATANEENRLLQLQVSKASGDIQEMQSELRSSEAFLKEANAKLEEVRDIAVVLDQDLGAARESLSDVTIQKETLKKMVDEGEEERKVLREQLEVLVEKVEGSLKEGTDSNRPEALRLQSAESALTVCKLRNKELLEDVGNLNSDIDRLTEANQRLQQEIVRDVGVQGVLGEDQSTCLSLQSDIAKLQEEVKREKDRSAHLQRTLERERERWRERDDDAGEGGDRFSSLVKECGQLRQHAETLSRSKTLLQKTMLEQLASVKGQLDATTREYRTLEEENASLRHAAQIPLIRQPHAPSNHRDFRHPPSPPASNRVESYAPSPPKEGKGRPGRGLVAKHHRSTNQDDNGVLSLLDIAAADDSVFGSQ